MLENQYLVSVNISKNTYGSLDYRFNGKELDPETGNYYYGARYYNPKISVWLSVDPLAHKYPSLSPYVFTGNNPIMLVDPDGRDIWTYEDGNFTLTKNNDNFIVFVDSDGNEIFRTNQKITSGDKVEKVQEIFTALGDSPETMSVMEKRAEITGFDNTVYEDGFQGFKSDVDYFSSQSLVRLNAAAEITLDVISGGAGSAEIPFIDSYNDMKHTVELVTGEKINDDPVIVINQVANYTKSTYDDVIDGFKEIYSVALQGLYDMREALKKGARPF